MVADRRDGQGQSLRLPGLCYLVSEESKAVDRDCVDFCFRSAS